MKNKIRVYYKPGVIDCYTVVIDKYVFAMSYNGAEFNQYVGDLYSKNYPNVRGFGKRVPFEGLDEGLKRSIMQRAEA